MMNRTLNKHLRENTEIHASLCETQHPSEVVILDGLSFLSSNFNHIRAYIRCRYEVGIHMSHRKRVHASQTDNPPTI
jgi:hypothetical protein